MVRLKVILLCIIMVLGMPQTNAQEDESIYSFFTAGHTYGNPNNVQFGLHQSFVDYFPVLNSDPKIQLGFLTGDVVYNPTAQYWDSAQVDMDKFEMPYYIAAGNHDMGGEFTERFGDYYFSFRYDEDLFIVLNPGLNQWNIEGVQLEFLEQTLEAYASQSRFIFIMLHQLIWWSPDNIFQDVIINWIPQYPGYTNFEDVVKPLLLSYPNQFYLYAGDVGSKPSVSPCMYYENQNLTLIASGMGSGNKDNIIISHIYEDHVDLDLIALNGDDPHAMGELSDWAVNLGTEDLDLYHVKIYPNPMSSFVHIDNSQNSKAEIKLFNLKGQLLFEDELKSYELKTILTEDLTNGIYVLKVTTQNRTGEYKLIKN